MYQWVAPRPPIDISWVDYPYTASTCDVMYCRQRRHLHYGDENLTPLPRSSPFIGGQRRQPIQMGHSPMCEVFRKKNMITCYHDNMIHRLTISRINYWNVRGFYRRHMVTLSCYHDNVIMFFSWKLHTLDTAFTFGEGVWGAVYIIFSYQCAPAPKRD
jgi:hypothetical protein